MAFEFTQNIYTSDVRDNILSSWLCSSIRISSSFDGIRIKKCNMLLVSGISQCGLIINSIIKTCILAQQPGTVVINCEFTLS